MSAARRGRSRILLAVPAVALALFVGACGDTSAGDGRPGNGGMTPGTMPGMPGGRSMPPVTSYPAVVPGPAAAGARNAADLAFATAMIPHHGQAVVMSDLLLARGGDAEVKALAQRIKQEQIPEIAAMAGWVKGWGVAVPDPYAALSGAMTTHGGMMSDAQLRQLAFVTGTAADKLFLTLMIQHHQGAIDMAEKELAEGVNPEATKLAQSIVATQSAEIAQMKQLLGSAP